jgi:hypothetical protein
VALDVILSIWEAKLSNQIEAGGAATPVPVTSGEQRQVVPMKVGMATVYIVQTGDAHIVSGDGGEDEIYTVAPDPREVFDKAVDVIREGVRKIGASVEALAGKAMPQELTVEFSLTFEAKAKGSIIPILVTAEHGLGAGLKISAVWKREDVKTDDESSPSTNKKGK